MASEHRFQNGSVQGYNGTAVRTVILFLAPAEHVEFLWEAHSIVFWETDG